VTELYYPPSGGAGGAVDVTDRAGRLLGIVSVSGQPILVDGSGVTQPVSIAAIVGVDVSDEAGRALGIVSLTGTADVSDRAGRLVGIVDTELPAAAALSDVLANPTTPQVGASGLLWDGTQWLRARGDATAGQRVAPMHVTNTITVTGGANAIATATLPAPGAGLFHYITHVFIARVNTAALAGGAILTVTTTNLNGRAWRVNNQASITVATHWGAVLTDQEFVHPIRSAVANTATTIVGPAPGAAVSWHMVIDYYIAP